MRRSAGRRIISCFSRGVPLPLSHRESVPRAMPSCSQTSDCFNPAFTLAAFKLSSTPSPPSLRILCVTPHALAMAIPLQKAALVPPSRCPTRAAFRTCISSCARAILASEGGVLCENLSDPLSLCRCWRWSVSPWCLPTPERQTQTAATTTAAPGSTITTTATRSTNIRTASVRMTSTIRPELTAALRPQAPVPTCRLCGGRILPKSRRIHPANLM